MEHDLRRAFRAGSTMVEIAFDPFRSEQHVLEDGSRDGGNPDDDPDRIANDCHPRSVRIHRNIFDRTFDRRWLW